MHNLSPLLRPLLRPRGESKHCMQTEKLAKEIYCNCNWLRPLSLPTMTPPLSQLCSLALLGGFAGYIYVACSYFYVQLSY